jgi:polyhydroxybutyrate depolymerase
MRRPGSLATFTTMLFKTGFLAPTVFSALVLSLLPACGGGEESAGQENDGSQDPGALTPDDCITDVSAGDHTFSCGGLTFLVMVDEQCAQGGCGLIFDVHGGTMGGAQMRDNTHLHELAPKEGYLVVHPSATPENTGGAWSAENYPVVADFMDRMMAVFQADPKRVHMTGFSQGSMMTFWFLCNRNELLASAAPVAGASDATCMNASWAPRVPVLYMNGTGDRASTIDESRGMVDGIVGSLALTGGEEIAGDGHYHRKHWQGSEGMVFDYIEHDYGGQAVLGGHCIPGGTDLEGAANNFGLNATTCSTGEIALNWGELALAWFKDHPKP